MEEDGERCRHAIFSPSLLESRERVVGRHLLTCPPHTLGLAQCPRTKMEKDGFISLFLQKKKETPMPRPTCLDFHLLFLTGYIGGPHSIFILFNGNSDPRGHFFFFFCSPCSFLFHLARSFFHLARYYFLLNNQPFK